MRDEMKEAGLPEPDSQQTEAFLLSHLSARKMLIPQMALQMALQMAPQMALQNLKKQLKKLFLN